MLFLIPMACQSPQSSQPALLLSDSSKNTSENVNWEAVKVKTLQGYTGKVWSVAVSSTGQVASASQDRTIKLWDTGTEAVQQTLNGHTD